MESREAPINLFRFEDPRQKRIYEKLLRLVGPGAASFYQDACRLMEIKPALETTTHLVAHSLREIESALRDVLEPVAEQANSLERKKSKGGNNHRTEILSY